MRDDFLLVLSLAPNRKSPPCPRPTRKTALMPAPAMDSSRLVLGSSHPQINRCASQPPAPIILLVPH